MLGALFHRLIALPGTIPMPPLVERMLFPHLRGERLAHWHQCGHPMFPIRLSNGELSAVTDKLYRRWLGDRWEFRAVPETEDEWEDRQI